MCWCTAPRGMPCRSWRLQPATCPSLIPQDTLGMSMSTQHSYTVPPRMPSTLSRPTHSPGAAPSQQHNLHTPPLQSCYTALRHTPYMSCRQRLIVCPSPIPPHTPHTPPSMCCCTALPRTPCTPLPHSQPTRPLSTLPHTPHILSTRCRCIAPHHTPHMPSMRCCHGRPAQPHTTYTTTAFLQHAAQQSTSHTPSTRSCHDQLSRHGKPCTSSTQPPHSDPRHT
eukprot:COSAG01_NODE_28078_length_669_cov_8.782456_1_plen_223_part_11